MRILLFGKDGQVGWELQRALCPLGELEVFDRSEADFEDPEVLRRIVRELQPDVVVNAAAYTAVDKAESEPDKAYRINTEAVGALAEEACRMNAWLVHYSTDYVFDGRKSSPYAETDPPNPLSVYGKTKLAGEELVRQSKVRHLIFRTSWIYSVRGINFPKTILRLAEDGKELKIVADQYGAPTSAELVADVTALALHHIGRTADRAQALSGTYHVTASGHVAWHEYARYVLELAEAHGITLKSGNTKVEPIPSDAYPTPAVRPKNSCLNTSKLMNTFNLQLPDWRYHVRRLLDELSTWEAS